MKLISVCAAVLCLSACVTPTYEVGPYAGRKKVGFKHPTLNETWYYLCKPGSNDQAVWARGEKAHAFALKMERAYYDKFSDRMTATLNSRDRAARLELALEMDRFLLKSEEDMEEKFGCLYYRTARMTRMGY